MKTYAKIAMNTLKAYSETVQQIVDYMPVATVAVSDFDNLIASINVEINNFEEKKDQLNSASNVIENKTAECEIKIEETQFRISELERDLAGLESELANTDEFITVSDLEGNSREIPNPHYLNLNGKVISVERQLSSAKHELNGLEQYLNRCRSLKRELSSVLFSIESKIENLKNNYICVEKNKRVYNNEILSVRKCSSLAVSKLSMIEYSLNNYTSAQLRLTPAFESARSSARFLNTNDIYCLIVNFKIANLKVNKDKKSRYDDEGKLFKNSDGLVPNSTFKTNGYTFETDNLGRPVRASGKLRLTKDKKDRDWDSTLSEIGQGDERSEEDDRGHMIGHRFDGPDSMLNAFPQDMSINRGEYKKFENMLASSLEKGKEVFVSVSLIYTGDSRRPVGLAVSYSIDGVRSMRFFDNEHKEGE